MGSSTGNDFLKTASTFFPSESPASQVLSDGLPGNSEHRSPSQDGSPLSRDYSGFLLQATNDAVRHVDLTDNRLTWPQGLHELLGYAPTCETNSTSFWSQHVHSEDYSRVTADINQAISRGDRRWAGEYRFLHANGSYIHLLERASILRDHTGIPQSVIGVLMDITERKQLQDQLVRSQKMEAFGQLASGAAHDFNNFLTTILGYSDLVLSEMETNTIVARHIGEIRKAAGRASNLAAQLLAFSRKQALDPQVVEVNVLITNLERSLLPLLGENISVVCDLHHEKDGVHMRVDPGQITQIILNLAVNARDAMPSGGQLKIRTAIVDLTDQNRTTFVGSESVPGQYVVISLKDTGAGMSEEVKAHLFEPFFTTKDRATGLGLATSYGIIRQSGGQIRIESEKGTGTLVEIYFPRVEAPAKPSYKKPGSRKLPCGIETILVLEDDISVRHISVRVLRSLGYQVIEAATGDDAQRLLGENFGKQVDLLLTDVVMPQMSGRHFADWFRKASPHAKVVFVSGYLDESLQQIGDGMFFLPKPFDPEQLAQTIRHALDA